MDDKYVSRELLLQVAERTANRLLMCFDERRGHLGWSDREEHADRLRC